MNAPQQLKRKLADDQREREVGRQWLRQYLLAMAVWALFMVVVLLLMGTAHWVTLGTIFCGGSGVLIAVTASRSGLWGRG